MGERELVAANRNSKCFMDHHVKAQVASRVLLAAHVNSANLLRLTLIYSAPPTVIFDLQYVRRIDTIIQRLGEGSKGLTI